jgi:hypothetical protein
MSSDVARQGAAATAWAAARRGSPATAPNRSPVPKFGRDGTYGREFALSWGFPPLGCLERPLPSAAELGPAAAHGASTAPAWGGFARVRTVASTSRRSRCRARVGGTCSCACRTGPSRPAARRGSPATAPNRSPVPKFGRDGTYGREFALSWGFPPLGLPGTTLALRSRARAGGGARCEHGSGLGWLCARAHGGQCVEAVEVPGSCGWNVFVRV